MPSLIDLSGKQIANWTVLHRDADAKTKKTRWICRCRCGAVKSVMADSLQKGVTKSCGCYHRVAARLRCLKMAANTPPLNERFYRRILKNEETGCHVWIGGKQSDGYGVVVIKTYGGKILKKVSAHRYAWEISYGEIPKGMCVLHKCDNPPCVNPDHLFLGTLGDNNRDREKKGRSRQPAFPQHYSCEDNPRAKLTNQQALHVLSSTETTKALAEQYDVSYHTIWKIRAGKHWTKVMEQANVSI